MDIVEKDSVINNKETSTLPPTFAEKDLSYYLRMVKGDFSELAETQALKSKTVPSKKNIVFLFTSDELGKGDSITGKKLIKGFIQACLRQTNKPRSMIFLNSGVKLVCKESEVLNFLVLLNEQGTDMLVASDTIEQDDQKFDIKIGKLSSMDEICEQLISAWKVITF